MEDRKPNIRIMHTRITPDIRVSTAGIYYDEPWGERFQYETWCFSNDPAQRSFQVIHGSCAHVDNFYLNKSIRIHRYIASNLLNRPFIVICTSVFSEKSNFSKGFNTPATYIAFVFIFFASKLSYALT